MTTYIVLIRVWPETSRPDLIFLPVLLTLLWIVWMFIVRWINRNEITAKKDWLHLVLFSLQENWALSKRHSSKLIHRRYSCHYQKNRYM
jgi:hypothetical protein